VREGTIRATWDIERSAMRAASPSPTTNFARTRTRTLRDWPMLPSGSIRDLARDRQDARDPKVNRNVDGLIPRPARS